MLQSNNRRTSSTCLASLRSISLMPVVKPAIIGQVCPFLYHWQKPISYIIEIIYQGWGLRVKEAKI